MFREKKMHNWPVIKCPAYGSLFLFLFSFNLWRLEISVVHLFYVILIFASKWSGFSFVRLSLIKRSCLLLASNGNNQWKENLISCFELLPPFFFLDNVIQWLGQSILAVSLLFQFSLRWISETEIKPQVLKSHCERDAATRDGGSRSGVWHWLELVY